jgi:hypothetical protein
MLTSRIFDAESLQLSVSMISGVDDSLYHIQLAITSSFSQLSLSSLPRPVKHSQWRRPICRGGGLSAVAAASLPWRRPLCRGGGLSAVAAASLPWRRPPCRGGGLAAVAAASLPWRRPLCRGGGLTAVAAASSSVSGKTFYWRGFVSDRGSVSRPAVHRGRGRGGRGGLPAPSRGVPHTSSGIGGGRGRARPTPYQRSGPPRGGVGKIHSNN